MKLPVLFDSIGWICKQKNAKKYQYRIREGAAIDGVNLDQLFEGKTTKCEDILQIPDHNSNRLKLSGALSY